jgi:hypothetical protein
LTGDIYSIADIQNNGLLVLKKVLFDGSISSTLVLHLEPEDFLNNYSKSKTTFERVEGWPENAQHVSKTYMLNSYRNLVMVALDELVKSHPVDKLFLMTKPNRVCVTAAFKKSQLVLVPATKNIKIEPVDSEFESPWHVELDFPETHNCFLLSGTSKDCVVPAFLVKPETDKKKANLEIVHKDVYVSVGLSKEGKQKGKFRVGIPVLTNFKDLKKEDLLLVYTEEKKKGNKRPAMQLVKETAKKPKD